MASYQRVALFILFDAIEADLTSKIRSIMLPQEIDLLSDEERVKAMGRIQSRPGADASAVSDSDLLTSLDLGDKISVLSRHKSGLSHGDGKYFSETHDLLVRSIPVRNAIMHGRPLTTTEYALGFATANDLLKNGGFWPSLRNAYREYTDRPHEFLSTSIALLDEEAPGDTLNNLPIPDYDDTGFLPRPALEADLKKKILGRHPVVTVIGEGGNGKTALTLQVLYGLLNSNDHDFDAIVWVSAKSSRLLGKEVERVENAISTSMGVYEHVADMFEPGDDTAIERVRRLLEVNKILLVIDNLETVLDDSIRDFAQDVPGSSKILFTSRVPLGSDLAVRVHDFKENEARTFLRRLTDAYDIGPLKGRSNEQLDRYARRLGRKPLLLKWFALGVSSGLQMESIIANPDVALSYCMENVIESLDKEAKRLAQALSALPSSASPNIIADICSLSAIQTESALATLLRFDLIERDDRSKHERLYQVRPFAKAYVARHLRLPKEQIDAILARYRAIDVAYQEERGGLNFNRYDVRAYTVRSRSEALTARQLKRATNLAYRSDFTGADEIIRDVKISNPDYFEVYRADAYCAERQGDAGRALTAFEAAIELAEDQPQLHFFYAGFLNRALGEYSEASRQLDIALRLDPKNVQLLREAARAKFFQYDFPAAEDFIEKIKSFAPNTLREQTILADLQSQLLIRRAEFLLANGVQEAAVNYVKALLLHLGEMHPSVIDDLHVEHLLKAKPMLETMRRMRIAEDENLQTRFDEALDKIAKPSVSLHNVPGSSEVRIGFLRPQGRTERFGFIRDQLGIDTFVARSTVTESVWAKMCAEHKIIFRVFSSSGRTSAGDITVLD